MPLISRDIHAVVGQKKIETVWVTASSTRAVVVWFPANYCNRCEAAIGLSKSNFCFGSAAGVQVKPQGERESPEQAFISTRIPNYRKLLFVAHLQWCHQIQPGCPGQTLAFAAWAHIAVNTLRGKPLLQSL